MRNTELRAPIALHRAHRMPQTLSRRIGASRGPVPPEFGEANPALERWITAAPTSVRSQVVGDALWSSAPREAVNSVVSLPLDDPIRQYPIVALGSRRRRQR